MIRAYKEAVVVALLNAKTRPRRHPATMHAHSIINQASRHQIPHFGRWLAHDLRDAEVRYSEDAARAAAWPNLVLVPITGVGIDRWPGRAG